MASTEISFIIPSLRLSLVSVMKLFGTTVSSVMMNVHCIIRLRLLYRMWMDRTFYVQYGLCSRYWLPQKSQIVLLCMKFNLGSSHATIRRFYIHFKRIVLLLSELRALLTVNRTACFLSCLFFPTSNNKLRVNLNIR